MSRVNWKINQLTDQQVVEMFGAIKAEVASTSMQLYVNVMGESHLPPVEISNWKDDHDLAYLISAGGTSLNLVLSDIQGVPGLQQVQVVRKSDEMDELHATYAGAPNDIARVHTLLQKYFPRAPKLDGLRTIFGSEVAKYYEKREGDLVRLEGAVQQLVVGAAEYRAQLDREATSRRESLEAEIAAERAQLQEQYNQKFDQLQTDRSALEELKQTIDDREAKHARRALRDRLQGVLAEHAKHFALTGDTVRKRRPVHALFMVALAATAGYVMSTIVEGWGTPPDYLYAIRVGAGILGFGGTLIFYIRWVDAWFKQHADEEFTLKRMSLDIDRASWVVETAMEWQKENKQGVPDLMLDRLTADLFSRRASKQVSHPAEDALTTVLGAASKVHIKLPGGSSVDLDKKGAKSAMADER